MSEESSETAPRKESGTGNSSTSGEARARGKNVVDMDQQFVALVAGPRDQQFVAPVAGPRDQQLEAPGEGANIANIVPGTRRCSN